MTLSLSLSFAVILAGGWLSGRLFSALRLPPVLGMVIFGIAASFGRSYAPPVLAELDPFLKSFALMVILLRAGLGISRSSLSKAGITAILMSFLPCLFEGAALTILFRIFFDFGWPAAGLTAFMLSAVSPAVIVPSMLDLKAQNKGKRNDVPTIILAGASADDVFAITLFSVFLGFATSGQTPDAAQAARSAATSALPVTRALLSIPLSIGGGILAGIVTGLALSLLFRRHHASLRATEKALILLVSGTLLVRAGDTLHFAALLGLMTAGFIILERHERVAHELASKLGKIWIFAEIFLFVLIGFSLDVSVALDTGTKGLAVIAGGLVFRSLGVLVATAFSRLTLRERLFCVIAYIPKATVQAALGGVALSRGMPEGNTILAIAVLAIVFTAPAGLLGIRFFGPRLLDQAEHA